MQIITMSTGWSVFMLINITTYICQPYLCIPSWNHHISQCIILTLNSLLEISRKKVKKCKIYVLLMMLYFLII